MKNTRNKILLGVCALLSVGALVGCGPKDDPDNPPAPPIVVDTEYKIQVTAPSGIEYTVSKEKAKKDESVTLTITTVPNGFSIKSVVMNKTTELTGTNNVYTFTMPNRSVSIVISVSVTGDVVLEGDIAAQLTLNPTTGVYELLDYAVTNGTEESAQFGFKVGSQMLKAEDFNSEISFGDVSSTYKASLPLSIATGCSYNFYYDPAREVDPCWITRTQVNVAPTNVSTLASLMLVTPSLGYEHLHVRDLTSYTYEINDITGKTAADGYHHQVTFQRYADNKALTTIHDAGSLDDDDDMYIYKDYNAATGVYKVVDTYPLKHGSVNVNNDPSRLSYNNYGAYAATFERVEGDDYDVRRNYKNEQHILKELSETIHLPGYSLEREFMYAYRVNQHSDETKYSKINITPSEIAANGSFTVTISSMYEYAAEDGVYTQKMNEVHTHDLVLGFTKNGSVSSINYKVKMYDGDNWNFEAHAAKTGQKGTTIKTIVATYSYAQELSACTFDASPYFINEITSLSIFDEDSGKAAADGNYSCLGRDLYCFDSDTFVANKVVKMEYAPATALDIWQYGPQASSNENVIVKEANDINGAMSCVAIGSSNVTFGNHLTGAGAGATKTIEVNVISNTKIRDIYLYEVGDNPWNSITTATETMVKAGSKHNYVVVVTPNDSGRPQAPRIYTATSSDTSLCTVTSAPNDAVLKLDFSGSVGIDTVKEVKITLTSTEFDYDTSKVFKFYIAPADINPVGVWGMEGYEEEVRITFTNQAYQGDANKKVGTIVDEVENGDTLTAEFWYIFDGISLTAKITSIDFGENKEQWSLNPSDYELVFEYQASTGRYGVGLKETEYDEYYEDNVSYVIYGALDQDGEFVGLSAFVRIS